MYPEYSAASRSQLDNDTFITLEEAPGDSVIFYIGKQQKEILSFLEIPQPEIQRSFLFI